MSQKLTVDKIYEQEFSVDFKGYNPQEVDTFLDMVLNDYELFQKTIASQQELLKRYEETVNNQKRMITELEANKVVVNETIPTSQVDLIRRVSKLEEIVYNNK